MVASRWAKVVAVAGASPGWLHWLARVQGGRLYLIAVNDGDREGQVVFKLPATPKAIRVLGEVRALKPSGTMLPVSLPRLALQCYEIELTAQ